MTRAQEIQEALDDAIYYHELQAKSIQEAIGKANHPRAVELYEDAKRYNETALTALREKQQRQPDPITGLVPCGCGEWIYTIEKGSCMDYHVTAKCSECGWDWFSKDGVGNCSAVFGAFITNGDSKRDEAERFLIENAKANNKLNYCPNCGAKMEVEHGH